MLCRDTQLRRKIKENVERDPSCWAILSFGRHREKTFEWVSAHDNSFVSGQCRRLWRRVLSPQLRECAEHVEQFLGAQVADVKGSRGRAGILDETNGAENNSEVKCNLNTAGQEAESCCGRARINSSWAKPGGSPTEQAGHTARAEIGNVGQSELLCPLGGRTLRIFRETSCDMLTREGSARTAGPAHRQLPDSLLVPSFLWLLVSARGTGGSVVKKLYRGRRLVPGALKLAWQLLDTVGFLEWKWPRGCQAERFRFFRSSMGSSYRNNQAS